LLSSLLGKALHATDENLRRVLLAKDAEVEALVRDLTTPHRWASWSAAAILLGVALATLGGLLAVG
jgi:hypothetical protein